MAILMWLVETIDIVAGDLDGAGIHPRDADGLPGSPPRRSCTPASAT